MWFRMESCDAITNYSNIWKKDSASPNEPVCLIVKHRETGLISLDNFFHN